MIECRQTMDDHSLEIHRDGHWIGHILWHSDRSPRIKLNESGVLTVAEAEQIIAEYRRVAKLRGHQT